MKLRIEPGSLGIRLTESDLGQCLDEGCLVAGLGRPGSGPFFRFAVELCADPTPPALALGAWGVRVTLYRGDAETLARDSDGRVTRQLDAGDEPRLTLSIERDRPESCPSRAMNIPCPLRRPS